MLEEFIGRLKIGLASVDTIVEAPVAPSPDDVRLMINSLSLASSEELELIARRSYRHPNGFDKIVLHTENAFTVRLHYWQQQDTTAYEHIHSHRWDYCTFLLFGDYDFEVYARIEGGGGPGYHDYIDGIAECSGVYEHTEVGRVELERIITGRLVAGSLFGQRAAVPHRVIYRNGAPTATLLVHGPFLTSESHVYTPKPLPARSIASRKEPMLDVPQLKDVLARVAQNL